MALVDYSLERFPEDQATHLEAIDGIELLESGDFDMQAEEQAHQTNLMIGEWIRRLATSEPTAGAQLLSAHTYVGLHHVDIIGGTQTEKFEIGLFSRSSPRHLLVPPAPFLTLYSWRVQEIGFGVIWTSLGFRCQKITPEAEEAIYQHILAAARHSVRSPQWY